MLTVDEDFVVHFANAEARRLLGGRLAEGDQLPESVDGFSLREFVEQLFRQDATPVQRHVTPDEERAYGLVGIPAQPEGETALIVIDDLTEQERRELAEREFVSNAAHELRTPLTTIIGAVEVLGGAKDDPAQRDRFLGHIEREAERLARLARALLTLARAHAGQERPRAEPVELEPLLREVADSFRPREGVSVELECPPGLVAAANRDLLEQALRNLGENAAKHTALGHVVLRAFATAGGVTLEVEDTARHVRRRATARLRPLLPGEEPRRGGLRARACDRARVGDDARRKARARVVARRRDARAHRARGRAHARGGARVTEPTGAGSRILLVDDDPGVRDVVAFMSAATASRSTSAPTGRPRSRRDAPVCTTS